MQNTWWEQTEAYPLDYYFDISGTDIAPCTDYLHCNGHQAQGYTEKVYGAHYSSASYSAPVINGVLNPDTVMLPTALPCDFHGTWRQGGTQIRLRSELSTRACQRGLRLI
jgi:hypothetical protein